MLASLLFQCSLIVLLILLPLLSTQAVPVVLRSIVLESPPGPSQPPTPAPPQRSLGRTPAASELKDGQLLTPVAVPRTVTQVVDPPQDSSSVGPPGNIFSVPGGTGDGSDRSILTMLPPAPVAPPAPRVEPKPQPAKPVRVGGDMQAALIMSKPIPPYPPMARAARISGVVRLAAVISEAGVIEELRVVEGHPLLVRAAVDAVKQWRYRPTILNGNPVKVATTIDVIFNLGQ